MTLFDLVVFGGGCAFGVISTSLIDHHLGLKAAMAWCVALTFAAVAVSAAA